MMLIIEDHTKSGASQSDSFSGGDRPSRSSSEKSEKKCCRGEKGTSNPVPKLIDNKVKHHKGHLSAPQRDEILLNESKEDSQFEEDKAETIQQSNETFAQ